MLNRKYTAFIVPSMSGENKASATHKTNSHPRRVAMNLIMTYPPRVAIGGFYAVAT